LGHDQTVRGDQDLLEEMIGLLGVAAMEKDAIARAIVERDPAADSMAAVRHRIDRELQVDPRFSEVADGVVFVPALVEGTTWTVWVDADDAKDGFVRTHPQLSPLAWWLVEEEVDLVDQSGERLGTLVSDDIWLEDVDTDVVFGPDGWLDGLAGGWASVSVIDGALSWSPCADPPVPNERQVALTLEGFRRTIEHEDRTFGDHEPPPGQFTSGAGPILEALVQDRDAFVGSAIAPLSELYRAAGLVERSRIIAEDGFDWDALRAWQTRNRIRVIHRISPDQVERLTLVLDALDSSAEQGRLGLGGDDEERDAAAQITAALEDGEIAEAFWKEWLRRDVALPTVTAFADALADRIAPATPIGLTWLRARCLDWSGDALGASRLLDAVVTGSCPHLPAVLDAAAFASDRGDATAGFALLRDAGLVDRVRDLPEDGDADDEFVDRAATLLDEFAGFALHRPGPTARRNDPCPCGSGRKYKVCHLGREQHPLADRASWLYDKAKRFLESRHPEAVSWLAQTMADPSDSIRLYEELRAAPFVLDVALHEDRVFAQFLASRHELLPDDEALLASQWALVDRGAFEIVRVDGDRLDLVNIATADELTVVNTHPSDQSRAGVLMLGRPLPVGDTYRAFSGFIEIPRDAVPDLLDAIAADDVELLAECLGRLFCPPRLQNTDGHDLELHSIRWRIDDASTVGAALRGAGLHAGDDASSWHMTRPRAEAPDTIIAMLTLDGDRLVGEVNSRERADMLRATIAAALPSATFIEDDARSVDDALADHDPDAPTGMMDPNDPAVRELMTQVIADHERRWIDESIPALGGRTPRDAVTDPIGREQVEQLLASFPVPDASDVGTMHPDRIRKALGI
jgi:hypothetical protein